MKDKLILKNEDIIEIESGSSLSALKVVSATKADMVSSWDKLTNENLKSVHIYNGDGVKIGTYENLMLVSETSSVQKDGTIITSFSMREKTETELLREELEAMKVVQEIQDGAISDLGTVVSEIASGGTV